MAAPGVSILRSAKSLVKTDLLLRKNGRLFQTTCRLLATVNNFKASDVSVTKASSLSPKPDWDRLSFGHHFSDHMLTIDWSQEAGWAKPSIHPVEEYRIHPAAKVFHYAVELFEGMKAFRGVDDKIRLFRPQENMKRMNATATRSSLPNFDGEELIKLIKQLIELDQDWVPPTGKSSLYIRPTMIGTEPTLGVSPTNKARLFVLVGPVGPYFPTGMKPVSLLADPTYVRAWVGGTGDKKMGSNYAPTMYTQILATQKGCQQVLWLYGPDHEVTEVGAMNFFMFWKNEQGVKELITSPLTGVILPGVTRKSLIDLANQWGDFKMAERRFTMADVTKALKENRVLEMFGCGTACVVCPIERIVYQGQDLHIPTMDNGAELTNRYLKHLQDIQYGRIKHEWAPVVC